MTILCYHAVQPGWTAPMSMEPEAFEAHATWLARSRRVVPLEQLIGGHPRRARRARGAIALTFDDGFDSLYHYALPLLRRLSLPATVFLVAGTLAPGGRAVDWVDHVPKEPLRTLDLEQIHEMQAAGVRFESHSYSHRDLTSLDFEECVRDLTESRELLESLLGHRVELLAYPRGRHNEQVRAAAARAGYTHGLSLPETREATGPFAVPRVGIYHDNRVRDLRIKSSNLYLRARMRTSPGAGKAS